MEKSRYKKTVVYDPLKSETYRALVEDQYAGDSKLQEVVPAQPRAFYPNRVVPGKVSFFNLSISREFTRIYTKF